MPAAPDRLNAAPTPPKGRLLIVDDDRELCALVADYLQHECYAVALEHCAAPGVEAASSGEYDLVILDVMLPDFSGFEALRRIRAQSTVPVLMLTARGDDVDRIVGLEIGADDYMPKPFNPRELVARIQAVLRRARSDVSASGAACGPRRLVVDDAELDLGARTLHVGGRNVELTSVEFDLAAILLRRAGEVVRRDELFQRVLGRRLQPDDRSIDMHVSHLRKKMGHRVGAVARIRTIRSVGYQYAKLDGAPGGAETDLCDRSS